MQEKKHIILRKSFFIITVLIVSILLMIPYLVFRAHQEMVKTVHAKARASLNLSYQATEDFYNGYTVLFQALAEMDSIKAHDSKQSTEMLIKLNNRFKEVVNFAAVKKDGTFFASGKNFNQGKTPSVKNLDFFKRIAAGRTFAVMNPHMGPISQVKVTGIVVPILDRGGGFNGLVGASIRFSALESLWQKVVGKSQGLELFVTDSRGVVQFATGGVSSITGKKEGEIKWLSHKASSVKGGLFFLTKEGLPFIYLKRLSASSNLNLNIIAPVSFSMGIFVKNNKMLVFVVFLLAIILGLIIFFTYGQNKLTTKILQSETEYRVLLNSLPHILVGVSSRGLITHWNRIAEENCSGGCDIGEGKPVEDLFIQLQDKMDSLQSSMANNQAKQYFKSPRKHQGRIIYENITIHPVSILGKKGAVIQIEDVTERINMEEAVVQSEKMTSLGGLAAGMAHEINNPIAGILQNVQVLENRIGKKNSQNSEVAQKSGTDMESILIYAKKRGVLRIIENIKKSGARAAFIVKSMLEFSYNENAHPELHDLHEIIRRSLEFAESDYDLKKRYDFRDIAISRDLFSGRLAAMCVRSEIEQVIINILKNAAHAMAESDIDKPEIRVRTSMEDGYAVISIKDNGPGMSESVRKRIFEPFFTTREEGKGTGMGLSVSYFIITQNHGGELEALSSPGMGAEFVIKLPAKT